MTPLWSSADLAKIVAKIIESIKLIPYTTRKIKPFEAHFGRPPNTEISNIITKPSSKNLSYNKVKNLLQIKQHSVTQRSPGNSYGTGKTIRNPNWTSNTRLNHSRHEVPTPTTQRTRRCLATRAFLVRYFPIVLK